MVPALATITINCETHHPAHQTHQTIKVWYWFKSKLNVYKKKGQIDIFINTSHSNTHPTASYSFATTSKSRHFKHYTPT